jgi:hypothetical protein
MKNKVIPFAAAAFVGVAALAASSAAQAAHWALVPDADDAYTSGYVVAPEPFVAPPPEIVIRARPYLMGEPTWDDDDGYVTAAAPVYSNCTVHREPGWFGGTYETRECR